MIHSAEAPDEDSLPVRVYTHASMGTFIYLTTKDGHVVGVYSEDLLCKQRCSALQWQLTFLLFSLLLVGPVARSIVLCHPI